MSPRVPALRDELAGALARLDEPDLRVLAWMVRQLPSLKLATELRGQVRRGPKSNDPTPRAEFARAVLLGLVREVAVVVGVHVPTAAALRGELTGPSPTPPEQCQAIEVR